MSRWLAAWWDDLLSAFVFVVCCAAGILFLIPLAVLILGVHD